MSCCDLSNRSALSTVLIPLIVAFRAAKVRTFAERKATKHGTHSVPYTSHFSPLTSHQLQFPIETDRAHHTTVSIQR